jgi:hypothetical protein
MKVSSYQEVLKDSVAFDVQSRFADEIGRLHTLGFDEEFYIQETAFPFSALILSPILIYAYLIGERIRVGGTLQLMFFNPCLIHNQGYAYSALTKLGVKYSTMFDDGTLLATASYDNGTQSNPDHQYIRQFSLQGGLEGAWKKHVKSVGELSGNQRAAIKPIGMKDVIRMERRSDKIINVFGLEKLNEKRKKKHDEE